MYPRFQCLPLILLGVILLYPACNNEPHDEMVSQKAAFLDYKSKHFEKALKHADKSIGIKYHNANAHVLRGKILFEMNRFPESGRDLATALELDSNNTEALYYLGMISYETDDFKAAINFFDRAMESKGNGGLVFESSNNFSEITLTENVSVGQICLFRGVAYYYERNLKAAATDLFEAVKQKYELGGSYFFIGACAMDGGNNEMACKYFNLSLLQGDERGREYLPKVCK